MPHSRRDFIKTVVLSSGTVFMRWSDVFAASPVTVTTPVKTSSQQFQGAHSFLKAGKPLPRSHGQVRTVDCVVIGGGAAGMAAAWRLKKAGKEFLVIENEPSLGGVARNMQTEWRGFRYPLGSTYFYRYDGMYREFLDDIGVRPIETGEDALYFGEQGAFTDWWNPHVISTLPIPAAEREAFRKFREVLLASPAPGYPVASSSDALRENDTLSARAFVERFGSPVLTDTMDLYARSVLGAPLSEVNAYAFINFYSVEFGDAFQIPCYTFPGGLGAVATAAERYVGADRIVTNTVAVSVSEAASGVETTCVDVRTGEAQVVQSKSAILTVPKNVARHVVKGLPSTQYEAMGKVRYAPYVTIALCCAAPLFDRRAFDFWVSDKERRFTDIVDVTSSQDTVNGTLDRKGDFVYMLSSPRPAHEFKGMDEHAVSKHLALFAQKTADAVAGHVPGAREKIREMHVFAWGHSLVVPEVGCYGALAPIIAQPHGNIHFAHSDNDIVPGWENAVWWGAETARRLI